MDRGLLSVIIPVYNVKPYLEKCIYSVLQQDYSNIEIIVVDDGSTDGSSDLCKELSKRDERISVYHKENGGLSSARNYGLEQAKGQWVAFVDSDDWVDRKIYSTLIELAVSNNVSISSCSFHRVTNEEDLRRNEEEHIQVYNFEQIIEGLKNQTEIRFEVWNKVWRRDLIGDTRFIEGQVSEDVHWDRILFTKAKKIAYTSLPLYYYRVGRPGNTNSSFRIARMCVFEEFDKWANDLQSIGYKKEANIIKSISMGFALIIYEEAYRTGQSKEILHKVYGYFKAYYPEICNSHQRDMAAFIFNISPTLYCKIIGLKRRMNYGK